MFLLLETFIVVGISGKGLIAYFLLQELTAVETDIFDKMKV